MRIGRVLDKVKTQHIQLLQVHRRGACIAGVYTHEVAETKIARVEAMAREAEFPFLATMERDE